MRFNYPFLTLTQTAEVFDSEPVTVGQWLTGMGLRERDPTTGQFVPTQHAHDLGLAKRVEYGTEVFFAWRNPQIIERLVAAGHSLPGANGRVVKPGSRDEEEKLFSYRKEAGSTDHFEIFTNNTFHARCPGRENAATITKALNYLAEKKRISFSDRQPSKSELFKELFG